MYRCICFTISIVLFSLKSQELIKNVFIVTVRDNKL